MTVSSKPLNVSLQILAYLSSIKCHNSVTAHCNVTNICSLMAKRIQPHFGVKQLKKSKTMDVLHLLVQNYICKIC